MNKNTLEGLKSSLEGELLWEESVRLIYATDASAYRELPLAVAIPANKADLLRLTDFARKHGVGLIPRAAGTSIAGQVVGNGIIVDISKNFTRILEINKEERWVRVEPGVVLDELNLFLAKDGLFFGPETSTSNRCMIGGMVGNNSCGAHSLIYGSTREHVLSLEAILSDGSEVTFGPLSDDFYQQKLKQEDLEGQIYRQLHEILINPENVNEIENQFPHPDIERRNTGYALDILLKMKPFNPSGKDFNMCGLIAGSEGTLAFITSIKLNLVPLPPAKEALLCVHLESVGAALEANLLALQHQPVAIELMDKAILDLTKGNIAQNKNRFFIEGDPGALLLVEFAEDKEELLEQKLAQTIEHLKDSGYGYAFPVLYGADSKKVWDLRKAGLGVLTNMPGDAKPVPLVEDTAVRPEDLPAYIREFDEILARYGKSCVYYAHVATGELHLRPVLNLKDPKEVELFYTIGLESAKLVKKYRGSISGEHGDGRLRGEFIPLMIGEHNYQLLKEIKRTWDPSGIFNPGKIIETPSMNTSLRYNPEKTLKEIQTVFSFEEDMGILRAVEKCNGSAACRKTELIGGTMCPSYMGTRDERNTTRARANLLREFLTNSTRANPFSHQELYEVMDLCLSCKACKSECPSSVDMAKLKAEFLQQYYDQHGIPLRSRMIAYLPSVHQLFESFPQLANWGQNISLIKAVLKISHKRRLPAMSQKSLRRWFAGRTAVTGAKRKVYLFADEFTNFLDADLGIKSVLLLEKLGYEVVIPMHRESGRTFFSKGLIRTGAEIARENVRLLHPIISENSPLIGIEPSAILSFRDEYPELVGASWADKAKELARNCLTLDEFLDIEMQAGRITSDSFTDQSLEIRYHGHCQQKSIASLKSVTKILQLPRNYKVHVIPSGCCGMAGSFGYEKEHQELSMKIGELVLFPAVRKYQQSASISASGTSCRHQIYDGTGVKALHPVEILFDALK